MTREERTLLKMVASLVAEIYDQKAERQSTTSNDADAIRDLIKVITAQSG
jgi:hypothetical protein